MQKPIEHIVVLGGGTAGYIAAITLKQKLPQCKVEVVRSKQLGIIGVGEGTTVSVPNFLHGYLGLDPMAFHRTVKPTYKLGIKFLWGPRPYFNYTFSPQFNMQYRAMPRVNGFYCDENVEYACMNSALMTHDKAFVRLSNGAPGVKNDVAYHIENKDLAHFLESNAAALGILIHDEMVEKVEVDESGVKSLVYADGRRATADLWIDCSGFVSLLLGKSLKEPFISFKSSLFCERAVVGGWNRGPDEPIKPYTTAETMSAGWSWQIEHDDRINRGYVYSPAFISDEEAEREFRSKNPKVEATRVVNFISGCYERSWVKNVVAIGNAVGFVEPLESTSIFVICDESQTLAESLKECDRMPGEMMARLYNRRFRQTWDDIRRFLALHYKFNTRIDTPFWRACWNETDLAGCEDFVDYYAENGPSALWRDNIVHGKDVFGFEGYLSMMVGMNVPYRHRRPVDENERWQWMEIQKANRAAAESGLGMAESLRIIRSPQWVYRKDFYNTHAAATGAA